MIFSKVRGFIGKWNINSEHWWITFEWIRSVQFWGKREPDAFQIAPNSNSELDQISYLDQFTSSITLFSNSSVKNE